MLRLAGDSEGIRTEAHARGEAQDRAVERAAERAGIGAAAPSDAALDASFDLRAFAMRSVVPCLAERLRVSGPSPGSTPRSSAAEGGGSEGDGAAVGALIDVLLRHDLAGLCCLIDAARSRSRSLRRIYLEELAPAAAAIDRLAAADRCEAAAAALAFCNLRIVLRRYATENCEENAAPLGGGRVLVASTRATGGLPLFDLLVAADLLRRAGWDAWTEPSLASPSFARVVREEWFDHVQVLATGHAVGDATAEGELREIADAIRAIRRDGPNPRIVAAVCGPLFAADPDLAASVGADLCGPDSPSLLPRLRPVFDSTPITRMPRRRALS